MRADHADHAAAIARLVAICAVLEREPRRLGELAAELATLAGDLEAQFAVHLALEERVVNSWR